MTRARTHSRIVVAAVLASAAAVLAAVGRRRPADQRAGGERRAREDRAHRHDHAGEPDLRPVLRHVPRRRRLPDRRERQRRPSASRTPTSRGPASRPTHDSRGTPDRAVHTATARTLLPSTAGRWMASSRRSRTRTKPCPKNVEVPRIVVVRAHDREPAQRHGLQDRGDIPNYWRYARRVRAPGPHVRGRRTRGACPAHLYMVSGWSAICARTATRCRAERRRRPDAPASWKQARWRKIMDPDATTTRCPSSTTRSTRGPTSRTCCTRTTCRGRYYVFAGEEPDCDEITGPIICTPGPAARAARRTSGTRCRTSSPSQENDQLEQHQADEGVRHRPSKTARSERSVWLIPNGAVSEHPRSKVSDGQAWVTRTINTDHEVGPVGVDRDLRELGRLGRLLRPRRCRRSSTRTATASGCPAS